MKFDLISFGSAFIDIYLLSKEFQLKKTSDGLMLCEAYGKKITLDDNIMTTGGGATNAAVCFERMGLQTGLVACIGKDYWGSIVRSKLKEEGVSLVHLQSTNKMATSSSIALVGQDGGRTVLVHRAASNLLSWHKIDWERLDANWLYVTSLDGDFTILSKIIELSRKKEIKIAFNPGSGELKQAIRLKPFLNKIDILVLNQQEALMLFNKKKNDEIDKKDIKSIGSRLVVITNGRKGAKAYQSGGKFFSQEVIKVKTVEETGAGDAFGSAFVVGQIYNLSIEKSLKLAALNASSVVSHIGPKKGLLFLPEAKKAIEF